MSFGFKHGPPREEDLAFDVRFLANPHYEPELRELTGLDERVVEYIGLDGRLEELYVRLNALLDYLLPQYIAEGKAHLVIAIGCTGGRHRSVAIAEHLGTPGDGAVLRGPASFIFASGGNSCPYAWESTDSAGSAGTLSAPPRLAGRPREQRSNGWQSTT
jgi:hypothetical protein